MSIKTHQATAKRVKVSGGKGKKQKLLLKKSGQDHFNARESGKVTRSKRRGYTAAKVDLPNLRRAMPYSY